MSGKLDVSRIKQARGTSSSMPDKQIALTVELPSGKKETMQVSAMTQAMAVLKGPTRAAHSSSRSSPPHRSPSPVRPFSSAAT